MRTSAKISRSVLTWELERIRRGDSNWGSKHDLVPSGQLLLEIGGGKYGCGWRHKRGPKICSAERCIKPGELEGRVLGTIRTQILVPEIVEDVARRTLNLAKTRFDESHRTLAADRRRLDEVRLEERNLIREMAKLGASDEFYEVLGELREEKAAIQARIEATQPEWSPASLEKPVSAAISQIESNCSRHPRKGSPGVGEAPERQPDHGPSVPR